MQQFFLITAAITGLLSVLLGAFGAHLATDHLSEYALSVYKTAVEYQMFHSLALLLTAILMFHFKSKFLNLASICFLAGIIIFSGSLYLLSLTGVTQFGMITPVGGLAFILGWIFLIPGMARKHKFIEK